MTPCSHFSQQVACAQHAHCVWGGGNSSTCGNTLTSAPATTPLATTPAPPNGSVVSPTVGTSASLPRYGSALLTTPAPDTALLTTPEPDTEYLACGVQCNFGSVAWGITPGNCTSTCGDGLRSLLEACDDGNAVDGDGCSASCLLEEVEDFAGVWECKGLISSEALMDEDEAAANNASILLLKTHESAEEAAAANAICRRDVCKIVEGLSVAAAEFSAQVVSATVGTTIAVVTSTVVASSLASSVAGTAGGIAVTTGAGTGAGTAAGTGTASAGMGAMFSLVDQAQFLAIIGRVGGRNATEETLAFARGLDWVNFSPPFNIFGGSGGASRARRLWIPEGCGGCDSCVAIRFGEKLVVGVSVLVAISSLRAMCSCMYMRHYSSDAQPPDLSFPNWEVFFFVLGGYDS
jgi:cysteine-rich repeat protein